MIEASQRRINEQNVNPAVNEHFKLQIKTLQNAPRDAADKLKALLKVKRKGKEAAGAMTARNYVEYTSLTLVHNKLHFIIHIQMNELEKIKVNVREPFK
jgi:hypothetical protein